MLAPDYDVDLSLDYIYHWEMDTAKGDEFIRRYHLQNLSTNLAISLKVSQVKPDGRKALTFEILLSNTSSNNCSTRDCRFLMRT